MYKLRRKNCTALNFQVGKASQSVLKILAITREVNMTYEIAVKYVAIVLSKRQVCNLGNFTRKKERQLG